MDYFKSNSNLFQKDLWNSCEDLYKSYQRTNLLCHTSLSVCVLPFKIFCVKGVKKVENMWAGRWYGDGMRQRNKTCFFMGASPWATVPAKSLFQHGLSISSSVLWGISTCSTVVLATGCRGISALVHLLPLFFYWPWCLWGCFSHSPPPSLFSLCCAVILPFLKYVITELLPALLIGSTLASGEFILDLAGTTFVRHRSSPWSFFTKATCATPCGLNTNGVWQRVIKQSFIEAVRKLSSDVPIWHNHH